MIPVSPALWDALADVIGEASTEELYGPRPDDYNCPDVWYSERAVADAWEHTFAPGCPACEKFDRYVECGTVADAPNKPSALIWSPRTAVRVAVALGLATALIVASAAIHGREASHATIDPCAIVLTREQGPVCR